MTTKRVVVGVDDSDGGRRALDWALRYAKDFDATVEVVTAYRREAAPWAWVAGPVNEREWAAKEQAKLVDSAKGAVTDPPPVLCTLVEGPPVETLCASARGAEVLVLGSHGRGHLATALLGSVAAACIARATAPVVVIPTHDRPSRDAENAVVAVSGQSP